MNRTLTLLESIYLVFIGFQYDENKYSGNYFYNDNDTKIFVLIPKETHNELAIYSSYDNGLLEYDGIAVSLEGQSLKEFIEMWVIL
jgi:hypothetical protein